jgi:hypothetical protein
MVKGEEFNSAVDISGVAVVGIMLYLNPDNR